MAIGTILDSPNDLGERLSTVLAPERIHVERQGQYLVFRKRIAVTVVTKDDTITAKD